MAGRRILVAAGTVRAARVALDPTNRTLDVTGARATTKPLGLDRFWCDVRTHTLRDPLAYKVREIGDWILNDRFPEPGWYS